MYIKSLFIWKALGVLEFQTPGLFSLLINAGVSQHKYTGNLSEGSNELHTVSPSIIKFSQGCGVNGPLALIEIRSQSGFEV